MRRLFLFLLFTATSPVLAQRTADQFYANASGEHAWTVDNKRELRWANFFAKNPTASPTYDQIRTVIYDRDPNKVLYLDVARKRVVGQLDLETEKFSLLGPEAQRTRQALDKFKFPPGGPLPRIEQLFEPISERESGNTQRLELPPPTTQFPQLERSTWDSCYMSADRFLIRCTVRLDGDTGTYQLEDKPGTGRLSDITYERADDKHLVRGKWNLGQSRGDFTFHVHPENLNIFWGEFGFQPGKTVGAWTGVRRPAGGLKPPAKALTNVRKPVR